MADTDQDKDLEEAKRIMAKMLNTPPQPHKKASAKAGKPARKPKDQKAK